MAEMPCEMSVARAAPKTPMPRLATIQRSMKMFSTDEKMRSASGMRDSPIEVNMFDRMLYMKRNGKPRK